MFQSTTNVVMASPVVFVSLLYFCAKAPMGVGVQTMQMIEARFK